MIRSIAAVVLCVPLLAFAQAPKKSADQVWNDLYAKREGKEHQFNRFLAETVKGRMPGTALDIGMGQGRNSLFLAALGWQVTGFDISEVGVKQALAEAQKRDLKIDARAGMYMHEYLTRNASQIVQSLKPGGILYYLDTMDKADWERSGGKPVPVVRMIAVKEGK
ncbi:MAG TPA: methyltransferase domain-containing protein [Burkholderiales bacterium]|nr:methyltransferase domain-containing protein [Burkholderiales bacterium]